MKNLSKFEIKKDFQSSTLEHKIKILEEISE